LDAVDARLILPGYSADFTANFLDSGNLLRRSASYVSEDEITGNSKAPRRIGLVRKSFFNSLERHAASTPAAQACRTS